MQDPRMQKFHELISEERYREARGILETEDLDPRLVEKWKAWLDDLHKEEWQQVALQNDKLKVSDAHKARTEMAEMIGGMVGATMGTLAVIAAVYGVMSTPSTALMSIFLLFALILGVTGWLRFGRFLTENHGSEIGAGMAAVLILYLMMSGIPFFYYPEGPPLTHWIAGTLLMLPMVGYASWRAGALSGQSIIHFLNPQEATEPEEDPRLKKARSRLD